MGCDPTGQWDLGWATYAAIGVTFLAVGLAILLAAPTGGASLVVGGLVLSANTVAITGTTIVVIGTVIIADAASKANIHYAKESKKSKKERSTKKPSWLSRGDVDLSKSSQQNATDVLNGKYGKGNWTRGPRSEFNQIVKWIDRSLRIMVFGFIERNREN